MRSTITLRKLSIIPALALVFSAGSAWGVLLQSLSIVKHDRFYVGGDKQFIGDPYDWSGIGRVVDGGKWATMISPSYFVSANHHRPANGEVLRFYHTNDPGGAFEDRTVLSGQLIGTSGSSDLWLGRLTTPVSSSVAKYPILQLPAYADYVHKPLFVFGRWTSSNVAPGSHARMHVGLNRINSVSASGDTYSWTFTGLFGGDEARQAEGGDSGGSSFIISNGVPTVCGTHWFPNVSAFVPKYISLLNAAMLPGGEQVTVQTTYVAPPPVVPPVPPAPASERWNTDSSGSWADKTKWLSGAHYPYAVGNIATLDFNLTAGRNITLITPDPSITVGGIVFNDTDATGQNNVSNSGYSVVLDGNNLTLDNGTPGYHPSDLVVIEMPPTNRVGHRFTNTTGKLVMVDNVRFNVNGLTGATEFSLGGALLSGTRDVSKTGNAQLLVGGDNASFSGSFRIEQGLVQLRGHARALGTGPVTLLNTGSIGFNSYSAAPTIANNLVLEKNPSSSADFLIAPIGTDVTWQGGISSNGIPLSVNFTTNFDAGGLAYFVMNYTGDNSGLVFAAGKGFTANSYIGVGSANALGAANSALVTLNSDQVKQAGLLATSASAATIASPVNVIGNGNVTAAVIGQRSAIAGGTFSGTLTLNSNANANVRQTFLRAEAGGTVIFNADSVIANGSSNGSAAPLTKIGGGRVEINGANTFLGHAAVRSGELVLGHGNALGSSANTTTVSVGESTPVMANVRAATSRGGYYENTGTFTSGSGNPGTFTGAVTTLDGVTLAAGDRVLVKDRGTRNGIYIVQATTSTWVRASDMDDSSEMAYGQQIRITSGTINANRVYFQAQRGSGPYPGSVVLNSSPPDYHLESANPAVSLLTNGITFLRNINIVANGSTGKTVLGGINATSSVFGGNVTLNRDVHLTAAAGGSVTFSGDISGAFPVTKEGAGKVIFAGGKTYTGNTNITAGTLAVNGPLASSNVSVSSGATLEGGGNATGSIVVNGTISPGNGVGALSVGALTLAPNSAIDWEVGDWSGNAGAGFDTLLSGTLNLTATGASPITLRLRGLPGAGFSEASRIFPLLSATGGISGFAAEKFLIDATEFPATSGAWSVTQNGDQILLIYTATTSAFGLWQQAHFGANADDPDIAGPTADPDGDGNTNLLEYSVGSDPKLSGPGNWITDTVDIGPDRYLRLSVTKNPGATDITFHIEVSPDLDPSNWTPATIEIDTTSQLRARDPVSVDGSTRRFIRVRVTQP